MTLQRALIAAAFTFGLSLSTNAPTVRPAFTSDDLPCDPPPTRWCELRGGTFNYVTCQCEFPHQSAHTQSR